MDTAIQTESGALLHADAFEALGTIEDRSVDLLLTDPPFGILDARQHPWDDIGDLATFTRQWLDVVLPKLRPTGTLITFWPEAQLGLGYELFHPSRQLVWTHDARGFGDWGYGYTPILITRHQRRRRHVWRSNVLDYPSPAPNREADRRFHPTQKPLALIEELVCSESKPGDLVLDPFAGSATTAVACERLGRRWLCIEHDAGFAEAAAERLRALPFAEEGGRR